MRFVVYGAGAVGGVVGGMLHEAGHEAVLIARGEHGAAIRRSGLRLETPERAVTHQIEAVEHPGQVAWRPDDVVVLAVKSQGTAAAVAALAEQAPVGVAVVCMQNGVHNETVALRDFERVYGCCVMLPSGHLEPGVVQAFSAPTTGILDLGRFPRGVDDTSRAVSAALEGASFLSEPRPDIVRWKYRKLVMNLGNAVQALCGHAARGGRLVDLLADEAERCFAAAGIDAVSAADDAVRRGDHLRVQSIADQPRPGGSSWQSMQRRTGSIETDFLNGEIVVLARLHGVAAPANALIQRLARRQAWERRPPGEMSEADLLAMLG